MPKILIVGGSRGLGLGLATELAGRGWDVIATAREPKRADKLAELIKKSDGRVKIEQADVDDFKTVESLRARLQNESLDVLFVNAGISGPRHKPLRTFTNEEIVSVMRTNTFGPIGSAQILYDLVKTGTGVIAFMTSRVGSIQYVRADRGDHEDLYRASKAALNALITAFRARLKDKTLTVLALSPGYVRTEMTGPDAPLDIETSMRGMATVLEKARGSGKLAFQNYLGEDILW